MKEREFLYQHVYSKPLWKKTRLDIYNKKNGICGLCGGFILPIKGKPSYNVHHIIELSKNNYTDPKITYHEDNLMLLHQECHNKIHKRFQSVSMIKNDVIDFDNRDKLLNNKRSKK